VVPDFVDSVPRPTVLANGIHYSDSWSDADTNPNSNSHAYPFSDTNGDPTTNDSDDCPTQDYECILGVKFVWTKRSIGTC
jgi:hypothetical protein